jgi:hypothetical protein
MDFHAFATEELTALAKRLSDAANARTSAEVSALTASLRAEADAEIARARAEAAAEMLRAREAAEKLRDTQARLETENERLAAENAALTWELTELRGSAQLAAEAALIDQLARTFDGVASGVTIDDVLTAMALGLSDRFGRVAAFAVRDDHLARIYEHGIDNGTDRTPTSPAWASFLREAAEGPDTRMFAGDTLPPVAPFGGSPTLVVTIPAAARGDTLGIVYADDVGRPIETTAGRDAFKIARMLGAYGALRLERLTIELKTSVELRAYAQMLVDEVEYVHQADTTSGKPDTERIGRLRENLRCARQIYQQRVTLEGPAAASLLDEVIARTVDRRSGTIFGRELSALTTHGAPSDPGLSPAQAS